MCVCGGCEVPVAWSAPVWSGLLLWRCRRRSRQRQQQQQRQSTRESERAKSINHGEMGGSLKSAAGWLVEGWGKKDEEGTVRQAEGAATVTVAAKASVQRWRRWWWILLATATGRERGEEREKEEVSAQHFALTGCVVRRSRALIAFAPNRNERN